MDKDRESRTTIYFTDNYNPVRNIELGKLDKYIKIHRTRYVEAFRTFASTRWPCYLIQLVSQRSLHFRLGTVTRGTYQFLLYYADFRNRISQYY
jgi:hypothetical protein